MNFVKRALENGGSIHPLLVPSSYLMGPAVTNPSIYNDNGKILMNLRNINYTLYHSEKKKFEHHWGPLVYIHPENDLRLRTKNIMCEVDENMQIKRYNHIDTSKFPDKELWEFVGLEDARIVRWDGKLYMCGVRRDLETTGIGRMELSEIEITEDGVKEIAQYRIPVPNHVGNEGSYCEKNWMPILDMPYHFVKWTNGTEVVKYDIETNTTEQVLVKDWKNLGCIDLRGGSQVIPMGEYRVCLNHETYLFRSPADRKDGTYRHRFVVWDKDWNIVKVSDQFAFLNAEVEFAVGMCEYENDYLITFGFQDNAAYLLRVSKQFVTDFIFGNNQSSKFVKIIPTSAIDNTYYNYGNLNTPENPSWEHVPGWFAHTEVFKKYIEEIPSESTVVEVGCFMGRSTCYIAELIKKSNKDVKFYAIDTFDGSQTEQCHIDISTQLTANNSSFLQEYEKHLDYCKVSQYVQTIRGTSLNSCNEFDDSSIDIIYVDASHEYSDVLADITAWYPKLKQNGIICGDDYNHFPGVSKAVHEYFGDSVIVHSSGVWQYTKN
jgi:SAM-dependent methyltransferase